MCHVEVRVDVLLVHRDEVAELAPEWVLGADGVGDSLVLAHIDRVCSLVIALCTLFVHCTFLLLLLLLLPVLAELFKLLFTFVSLLLLLLPVVAELF